jgi:hypothetical protein
MTSSESERAHMVSLANLLRRVQELQSVTREYLR